MLLCGSFVSKSADEVGKALCKRRRGVAQLLPCTEGFEQQHSAGGLLRLKDPLVLGILSGEVFICIAVGTYQSAGAYKLPPAFVAPGSVLRSTYRQPYASSAWMAAANMSVHNPV